jgi:hypothetical protein
MITAQRKSKYKHKVIFKGGRAKAPYIEIRQWCEDTFGPGGRSRKLRWRFGWTDKDDTYYFKNGKDASMFLLRWT